MSLYLTLLTRLFIFIISSIGYCLFLNKKNINIYFCPIVYISICSFFLIYFGFIFNIDILTYIFMSIGIVLFIYYSFKDRNRKVLLYVVVGLLLCSLILLRTRGQFISSYDNFTHWATVVKSMLLSNKLPSENDIFIDFKTYPLGSSIWIYYVSKIVKNSEGFYMFAKELIIVCALFPILYYARNKNKYLGIVLFFIFVIFCSSYMAPINNLQVDNLLPIIALDLLILISENSNNIFNYFVAIYLMHIKNSGVLFLLFVFLLSYIKDRSNIKKIINMAIICTITFLLWRIHLLFSFQDLDISQQAFSLKLIKANILDKSSSDYHTMFLVWLRNIFSFSYDDKCSFYIPLFLSIIATIVNYKDGLRFSLIVNILFYLYASLTLLMFVLSMPREEAIVLSCFQRYMVSIAEFIIGLFIIYILSQDCILFKQIFALFAFILLIYTNLYSLFDINYDNDVKRIKFAKMIQYYDIEPQKNYLIVDYQGPDDQGTFSYWSLRYDLWSMYFNSIDGIDDFEFDDYRLEGYNYLIVITPTNKSDYYLLQHGYEEYIGVEYVCIKL